MANNKAEFRQLTIMMILTIIIQLFMLIKGSISASIFGVNIEIDAFNFVNNISAFIYGFIGAGVSTILIPRLGDRDNRESINTFLTILYTIAIIALLLMVIFRKGMISILSGRSESYFLSIACNIFVITLIGGLFNSFFEVVSGILQYYNKFNRVKIVTLISYIIIVIALLLNKHVNIYYYAFTILISTILSAIISIYFIKDTDFRYKPNYKIKNNEFKKMIVLFIPTIFSHGLYKISVIIDTMISSRLGDGQVSLLNYSNIVLGIVNILFLGNIVTFMYPRLVRKCKDNKEQQILSQYIIFVVAIMWLIVALFIVDGKQCVNLLYERGNFTSENTKIVFICATIYILSLPINAARDLIYKYFYINNDTKTPFKNSIVVSLLNIVISIILSKYIGLYGIVIGTVATSYISFIGIGVKFFNEFTCKFKINDFITENIKILIATTVSIVISLFIMRVLTINNIILHIVIYGLLIFGVWIILMLLMKSKVFDIDLKNNEE